MRRWTEVMVGDRRVESFGRSTVSHVRGDAGGWSRASARRWCPVTAARARHCCPSTCRRSPGPGVTLRLSAPSRSSPADRRSTVSRSLLARSQRWQLVLGVLGQELMVWNVWNDTPTGRTIDDARGNAGDGGPSVNSRKAQECAGDQRPRECARNTRPCLAGGSCRRVLASLQGSSRFVRPACGEVKEAR